MNTAQVTTRVPENLKKDFMKTAKQYGMPVSTLLSLMMKMIVEKRIVPEFTLVQPDNVWTDELEDIYQEGIKEFHNGETIPLDIVMKKAGLIK